MVETGRIQMLHVTGFSPRSSLFVLLTCAAWTPPSFGRNMIHCYSICWLDYTSWCSTALISGSALIMRNRLLFQMISAVLKLTFMFLLFQLY